MPIDPTIALSYRNPEPPDVVGSMGRAISLKSLMQQGQMDDMKLAAAQRDVDEEKAFREGLAANLPDDQLMVRSPTRFFQYAKGRADMAKSDLDRHEATLKLYKAQAERLGSIAGSIRDQQSYQLGIRQAVAEGLIPAESASQLPQQFGPETATMLQQFALQAMSSKEQHELELQKVAEKRLQGQADETKRHNTATETETGRHNQVTEGHAAATLTETGRHNQATEGLTREGHRITLRGQNMTDARARDAQAITVRGQDAQIALQANKEKQLGEGAVAKIAEGKAAMTELESLGKLLEDNKHMVGPVVGQFARLPYSESQRKVQAAIDRVRQRVGKALEGGVLRKEDEEKYKKILPTMTDTPDVAQSKIQQLLQTFATDLQTFEAEQARAGRRVPGAAPAAAPASSPRAQAFRMTASGSDGRRIGSNDGKTWFDLSTGKKVQ